MAARLLQFEAQAPPSHSHIIKPVQQKLSMLLAAAGGWRKCAYAGFCLLAIVAGALFLKDGPTSGKAGTWAAEFAVLRQTIGCAMVGFGLLLLATPWLISRDRLPALTPTNIARNDPTTMRWFLAGVVFFTICSGSIWSRRLDASLWTDEVTTMRKYTVGRWRHYDNDTGRMIRPSWCETIFGYKTPNNHLAYSVVARVLHEKVVGINKTDFSQPYFNAFVLRLPALAAGLATISLIGYLALRLHSLLAAWLAMGWATLHPWMMEFSTSARGYSFAIFFIALAAVAAVKIFRRGAGWRWWVVYGLAELLAFCSVPTVIHALVLLNLTLFIALLIDRHVNPSAARAHLGAFFATNFPCAFLAVTSFRPKLAQLDIYLVGQHDHSHTLHWMVDSLSELFVGQPYRSWSESHPWAAATEHWPMALVLIGVALGLLFYMLAMRHAMRSSFFAVGFALVCLLPPVTTFIQSQIMEVYLFPWYSAWHLPLWLVIFSCGTAAAFKALKLSPRMNCAAACAFFLTVGIATHWPRKAYLTISYEPQKESAAVFRESPNPFAPGHEKIISTSLVTANHAYDPWSRRLRRIDDLWEMIAAAEETGKPLYCDTAWIKNIHAVHPEFVPVLLDGRYFELVEKFLGLQPQNVRYVYRYRPGSLAEQLKERR